LNSNTEVTLSTKTEGTFNAVPFFPRLARWQVRKSPNIWTCFLHGNTYGLPPFRLTLVLWTEVSNPSRPKDIKDRGGNYSPIAGVTTTRLASRMRLLHVTGATRSRYL